MRIPAPLVAILLGACSVERGPVHPDADGDPQRATGGDGTTSPELGASGTVTSPGATDGPSATGSGATGGPLSGVDEVDPLGDDTGDTDARPNVLLVVADDMGVESFACDDRFPDVERAAQPTLQRLCDRGVRFESTWAYPVCSPTRAAIMTGRHSWRTGVGEAVGNLADPLSRDELTLPQALDLGDAGYSHALVGKWHLSYEPGDPNDYGWDHFAGAMGGEIDDFQAWTRVVDGVQAPESGYATSVNVDDALDWIDDQDGPWLLWLAFNAPHKPLHVPPADLHDYDDLTGGDDDIESRPERYHMAMIQAMDAELGRLLDGLDDDALDNTWVVFVGDNGSTANVTQDAWHRDQAKGTLLSGGVSVPLVVAGPGVGDPGRTVDTPVHVVDLYATLLELAGVDPLVGRSHVGELDATSLVPLVQDRDAELTRDVVMNAMFGERTSDDREGFAAWDGRYRLLVFENGRTVLNDLDEDPDGAVDLLDGSTLSMAVQAHHDRLSDAIDGARDRSRYVDW